MHVQQKLGWRVIDHNVRWREGELDLIALDSDTLVFAEIKTLLQADAFDPPAFSPFESIGRRKQRQVRSLARRWLHEARFERAHATRERFRLVRFDAFAVVLSRSLEVVEIECIEDAF